MFAEIGLFLGLGAFVGLIAPAAGIGGGLLMVPAFLWIFPAFGMSQDMAAHFAVGSSVAAASIMSISAIRAHARNESIDWHIFFSLAPGLVVGAIVGGLVAHNLPGQLLHRIFGGLMLLLAINLAFGRIPAERSGAGRPPLRFTIPIGLVIGEVGAMVGIGGGAMIVPFLLFNGVKSQRAAGTSSAAVLATVLTAAVTYLFVGGGGAHAPAYSQGYLYGPAIIATAATAVVFAPLGAKIAKRLPSHIFRRFFAILLVVIAIRMLA